MRVVVTSNAIATFGEWAALPLLCVATVASLVMATLPIDHRASIFVGIAASQMANVMLAYQGLCFHVYGADRESSDRESGGGGGGGGGGDDDDKGCGGRHGSLAVHNRALRYMTM